MRNKMDNKLKAQIIVDFTQENFNDDLYDEFFDYNDLGVPVAVALVADMVILTAEGEKLLNETWKELCELFGNDPNEEYEDYEEFIGE